ncbi:MAG: hypothetical protein R2684_01715 [Pyrinomonadaceae bacterium]
MKNLIFKLLLLSGMLVAFSTVSNAQAENAKNPVNKLASATAKTGVVVIGSAAKLTWQATKFTAGKVAKPLVVKAAPQAGKFALKQSGTVVKKAMPVVRKLAVTYLKLRLGP